MAELPKTDGIPFDNHACRKGELAAGYIVEYTHPQWAHVSNKLFRKLEDAVRYAKGVSSDYWPVIKSLRWDGDDSQGMYHTGDVVFLEVTLDGHPFPPAKIVELKVSNANKKEPSEVKLMRLDQAGATFTMFRDGREIEDEGETVLYETMKDRHGQ